VRELRALEHGQIIHRALLEQCLTQEAVRQLVYREAAGFGLFLKDNQTNKYLEKEADKAWSELENVISNTKLLELIEQPSSTDLSIYTEQPIKWKYHQLLIQGAIDYLVIDHKNHQALIVDYKTGDPQGHFLDQHDEAKNYKLQVDLYCLAVYHWLNNVGNDEIINPNEEYNVRGALLYVTPAELTQWDLSAEIIREMEHDLKNWSRWHREKFSGRRFYGECSKCQEFTKIKN
jgi:hypothetical protein